MSDETEATPAAATAATPATRSTTAPPSILTKPTDAAERPGFRSMANTKSKAQVHAKRKKKK